MVVIKLRIPTVAVEKMQVFLIVTESVMDMVAEMLQKSKILLYVFFHVI